MAHLTRRIPVMHSGAKDGWEEVDQVGFDPSKVYRSPIDLKVAACVRLHSHKFTWREAETISGFSDAFLGSRIWSLSEMIRVFAETVVQGNPEVPGYEVPQEYQWRIPYNRDFVLGKSAAYFTKAIRFTGGFDQVCEVLRSPATVALVIRSMVMQVIIEKVFRVSFFGFAVDESSIGSSERQHHAFAQRIVNGSDSAPSFGTACKIVALEILEVITPLLDIAAQHWPRRGPALPLIIQALSNQVSEAGLISVALRSSPGNIVFSMPTPGEPYHFRRHVERTPNSINIIGFTQKLSSTASKGINNNVILAVFVPLQPFVQRAPANPFTLEGIIAHGDVVTYETACWENGRQKTAPSSIFLRPHAFFWSLCTPLVFRKIMLTIINLLMAFFFFGLAFKIFWPAHFIENVRGWSAIFISYTMEFLSSI